MSKRTQIGFGVSGRRVYNRPKTYYLRYGSDLDNIVITIYNRSGGIDGKLFSTVGRSIIKEIEFSFDEHGCSSFKLELNYLPSFSINPMGYIGIKVFNTIYTWYSGLILDVPEYGVKKRNYTYSGQGLSYYITGSDGLKAEATYPAVTDIGYIVDDIVKNYITPYCSINYDSSKIENPIGTSTVSEIEISKAPISDVLDMFADMVGARWGIDGDRDLYFKLRESDSQKTRFAGHQVYSFKPKTNNREIKNSIIVTRQAGEGSNESGWAVAGVFNDDTSIAKYGKRELQYQIPAYFDDADAAIIGNALLERNKDPQQSAAFQARLKSIGDYYETEKNYRTILPYSGFNDVWLSLDDKGLFSKTGAGDSAIYDDIDYYIYGAGGIRLEFETADGDIWVNDNEIIKAGKIDFVRFWIRATNTGNYLTFGVGSSDWDDYTTSIPVAITRRWFFIDINLKNENVASLQYFGIRVDGDFSSTRKIWIDKVEIIGQRAKSYTLNLKKINYNFSSNGAYVKGDFGQNLPTMADYVQSLLKQATEFKYTLERR